MTIDEFVAITLRVVKRDGVHGYLPTACYPSKRSVMVLEGYPGSEVPAGAVHDWAAQHADGREPYFVAYKIDDHSIQIDLVGLNSDSRVLLVDS